MSDVLSIEHLRLLEQVAPIALSNGHVPAWYEQAVAEVITQVEARGGMIHVYGFGNLEVRVNGRKELWLHKER